MNLHLMTNCPKIRQGIVRAVLLDVRLFDNLKYQDDDPTIAINNINRIQLNRILDNLQKSEIYLKQSEIIVIGED